MTHLSNGHTKMRVVQLLQWKAFQQLSMQMWIKLRRAQSLDLYWIVLVSTLRPLNFIRPDNCFLLACFSPLLCLHLRVMITLSP